MGISPSKPSAEELRCLRGDVAACCREAAEAVRKADVLLLMAGAGFSADSGLPTYDEIANVKIYQDLGFKYDDICRPDWISHDPEIFYGFWGSCFNDYRDMEPHEGYGIISQWRESKIGSRLSILIRRALEEEMAAIPGTQRQPEPYEVQGHAGAFFAYTSNVDAHSYDFFEPCEVRECHGNTEIWQCGANPPCCKRTWRAPLDYKFTVNRATMRAPRKSSAKSAPKPGRTGCLVKLPTETRPEVLAQVEHSFRRKDENWPICPWCKSLARPHVLMFNDTHMASDMEQELRFQRWKDVVIDVARQSRVSRNKTVRILLLEIGCGGRVPTVRSVCETVAAQLRKSAEVTVVRINPEFPLPDRLHVPSMHSRYLCLPIKGLEGLRKIQEHYQEMVKPKRKQEVLEVKEEKPLPLEEPMETSAPETTPEMQEPRKAAPVAKRKAAAKPKGQSRSRSRRAGTAKGPPGVIKTLD